jgi:hypothetical protein
MTKQLTIVAGLMFAVACKTDAPSRSSSNPADESSAKARSAKIEIKPLQPPAASPSLPAPPAQPASSEDSTEPPRVISPPPDRDPAARGEWRMRRDTDGDGVVSPEERDAAIRDRMARMRTRLDTDGDGKVSPDELSRARGGRMRFDDPAALDTNQDGDISPDELAAGFRARREQRRNARDVDGTRSDSDGAQGSGGTAR